MQKSQNKSIPSMTCVQCAAGTHPGVETWRTAVGGRHSHLAPPSLRLLFTEPDRRGRTAVRRRDGPVPRGRAVSGQWGAAARSALLLLVLNGRLESYRHTHGIYFDLFFSGVISGLLPVQMFGCFLSSGSCLLYKSFLHILVCLMVSSFQHFVQRLKTRSK